MMCESAETMNNEELMNFECCSIEDGSISQMALRILARVLNGDPIRCLIDEVSGGRLHWNVVESGDRGW